VRIGELVWVRNGPSAPTWGIVVNELVTYLTDNSVLVSYEVLVDSVVWPVDSGDVLQFSYYNVHLYYEDSLDTSEGGSRVGP
jgi:hypothetical protein